MNRHVWIWSVLLFLGGLAWLSAQKPIVPPVYAITNARVITKPDEILNSATIVFRDGIIEAVGEKVIPPREAVVIDGRGKTVCAGFIDGLSNLGFDSTARKTTVGDPAPVDFLADALANTKPDNRRGLTPDFLVRSALKADDYTPWRNQGFTARLIAPDGGILLGQSALVALSGKTPREATLNGAVAQHLAFRSPGGSGYPSVLMGFVAHARQMFYDAGYHNRQLTAFAKGGGIGKRPAADPALEALVPALEGKMPVVIEADRRDEIERALDFAAEFELKPILYGGQDAWKLAKRLAEAKVPVILRVDFGPARSERQGTKRVRDEQARKRQQEIACADELFRAGVAIAFATQGQPGENPALSFRKAMEQVVAAGLPADAALAGLTTTPARLFGVSGQVGELSKGRAAHLVVFEGGLFQQDMKIRDVFIDGERFEIEDPKRPAPGEKKDTDKKDDEKKDDEKKDPTKAGPPPEYATELDADRRPARQTGGTVVLRNATVYPATGPALANTDIFILEGKIKAIGQKLKPEAENLVEIDCTGMHITPGIIDTHCHFAIQGGVNEASLSIVPEVRIGDVINSEDVQIYRALAGGVTTARLLHGSANVIGGQDAVLKMKYGRSAKEMLVTDGPRGVKFALGENVKRREDRFPNTRLGVEAVLIRAFTEAREYAQKWRAFKAGTGPEIRRDLRLEALADVLSGELKIHCHCYRSDEILMLLRVCERFGVRVASLQHVLEGYKVAPEIARHGASCSPFSDWWAYKWEAADAIPHCAALLYEAGISVCLKSDSNELMRHMFHEAAKTIKHGNMPELEALRSITLNPAKQLGLAKRIGSIEVGKDADLAIFNGHPFNGYARVEMTLIEGEIYFQNSPELKPNPIAQSGPGPRIDKLPMPARSADGRYVLVGATVHTGTNTIPNATVVIDRGRISAVREASEEDKGIPANGLHIYPGMIDAGSILGLIEIDSARETRDHAETGDFQPDLRAATGVNPDSELIPVTRSNGILSVVTRPTGGVIAGQSAVINLAGWTPRDMTVADPLALHIELPGAVSGIGRGSPFGMASRAVLRKQREAKLKQLRDLFEMAARNPASNPRLEALAVYARGEKPVIIQASRREEILEALKLADELKIKIILSGGLDAWKVADELKKRDVPVILGPTLSLPYESTDPYDAPYACAAKLHKAGIRFCIRSTGDSNTRNLPYQAAMAVAYGLPPDEALRSVTLYPAQILGVADELGLLRAGKRANLVITTGDILQATTQVVGSFIDGKPYAAEDKQTRLYERYRERIQEFKESR
jgi:imidazolonepropionase-like amidohydrolase